jgi:hypothetical protein
MMGRWHNFDGIPRMTARGGVALARGTSEAASVPRGWSPSASVVVLLKSDFLAYFC